MKTREQCIRESEIFVTNVPARGFPAGEQGIEDIRIAIDEEKQIYVWRTPERAHVEIPAILNRYPLCRIVDGDANDLYLAIEEDNSSMTFAIVQDTGYGERMKE